MTDQPTPIHAKEKAKSKPTSKPTSQAAIYLLMAFGVAVVAAGAWGLWAAALIALTWLLGWAACTAHAREEGYDVP